MTSKVTRLTTWSVAGAGAEVGQGQVQNVELRTARWGQEANLPWGSARIASAGLVEDRSLLTPAAKARRMMLLGMSSEAFPG